MLRSSSLLPVAVSICSVLASLGVYFYMQNENAELGTAYGLRTSAFLNSLLYLGYFAAVHDREKEFKSTCSTWLASFLSSFMAHLVLVVVTIMYYAHRIDLSTVGLFVVGTIAAGILAFLQWAPKEDQRHTWLFKFCWGYLWFLYTLSYVVKTAEGVLEGQWRPHHQLSALLYVGVGVYTFVWPTCNKDGGPKLE